MASAEKNDSGGDYDGRLLQQAAIYNNTELMASLLEGEEREHINASDCFGRTALYTSVTNNSFECARLLLDMGADPNIPCGPKCGCRYALHAAVLDNKLEFVELLLRFKADIDLKDSHGDRPLDLAKRAQSEDCIKRLRKEYENRQEVLKHNRAAFYNACAEGNTQKARELVNNLGRDTADIINRIPDGQNSLLFRACERGNVEMLMFLLDCGADGQVHPITGHSPLHAACSANEVKAAKVILEKYPELIHAPTIEGTLPVHLAVAHGSKDVLCLMMDFDYPEIVRQIYKERNGNRLYKIGFAINAKDGHGQTPLHIACKNKNYDIVKLLLDYKVGVAHVCATIREKMDGDDISGWVRIPYKPEDPSQQSEKGTKGETNEPEQEHFCPADVNAVDLDGYTPLFLAVRVGGNSYKIVETLLEHGANPSQTIFGPNGKTTAVLEACQKGDVRTMDLLLKNGANDDEKKVLLSAIMSKHDNMISTLLKYKTHVDPDHKVSRRALLQYYSELGQELDGYDSMSTFNRNLFPSTPVVINWHDQNLPDIKEPWLLQACYLHNPGFATTHPNRVSLLFTITRIDISDNIIQYLPETIFCLHSLRLLNASNNQIRTIGEKKSGAEFPDLSTSCPFLEEIQLEKNKLQTVPAQIFQLTGLQRFNLSHNELEVLPNEMWDAPSLVELNLSHNNLARLPVCSEVGEHSNHGESCIQPSMADQSFSAPLSPKTAVFQNLRDESFSPPPGSPGPREAWGDSPQESPKSNKQGKVKHYNYWSERVKVRASSFEDDEEKKKCQFHLIDLNLSYNRFEVVPAGLACLAPYLTKLNLSHNLLSQVGLIDRYPATLKWLDLGHNNMDTEGLTLIDQERGQRLCYSPAAAKQLPRRSIGGTPPPTFRPNRTYSSSSLHSMSSSINVYFCPHRMHYKLENLKTLKLSHNKLTTMRLATEFDPLDDSSTEEISRGPPSASMMANRRLSNQSDSGSCVKTRLIFPNLSVLDLSYNDLVTLPAEISEMINFTELKLTHNKLKELPPDMGLLKKLWNLDFAGCPVEREMQAMLGEKAKKTSAVLGYLKSIKEEATLYNRMKLMFVGIQGIGKTSLLAQLRKEGRNTQSKTKNWAQRMGHSGLKDKDLKGDNISTVGVDIGDLVLQRAGKEVIFRTWDFGGQKEYYATHQYFLSKRSLYLVVWKVTDGEKGINEILQWLVNIQARAPHSPVIIVGTHIDQISKKKYPPNFLYDMQKLIKEKFCNHAEPEKSGLPRVLGTIEVCCKSKGLLFKDHISDLINLIWDVVSEESLPGNRGAKLLEQKIPATYKQLQDVITLVAEERKMGGKDPVLHSEQYKPMVMQKMEEIYNSSFRDVAELNQATQFLHENGVLLHYDDVNLQDIYFLDPQWLCDVLANVVTIREINSLAKCGIMKTDDLKLLFKNAAFKPEDIKTYIIDLLNKFEVALLWDQRNLLIPSLLPTEEDMRRGFMNTDIRIPVRGSGLQVKGNTTLIRGKTRKKVIKGPASPFLPAPKERGKSKFYIDADSYARVEVPPEAQELSENLDAFLQGVSRINGVPPTQGQPAASLDDEDEDEEQLIAVSSHPNPAVALVRLYLMSYFPSGFWPRLITRLLADSTMYQSVLDMYPMPEGVDILEMPIHLGSHPEWKCWQTGVELKFLGATLLRVKEAGRDFPNTYCDYSKCRLVIKQEQDTNWTELNTSATSILEILIPNDTIEITFSSPNQETQVKKVVANGQPGSRQSLANDQVRAPKSLTNRKPESQSPDRKPKVTTLESQNSDDCIAIQPMPQASAAILAKIVDHIDTLLEDWYPDLGLRFVQNSRGMYLITRVVPCMHCLLQQMTLQTQAKNHLEAWSMVDVSPGDQSPEITQPVVIQDPIKKRSVQLARSEGEDQASQSQEVGSAPGWVENVYSSGRLLVENLYNRMPAVTGNLLPKWQEPGSGQVDENSIEDSDTIYCYLFEQCLQAAQLNKVVFCITHGNMGPYFIASHDGHVTPAHVAPDAVFQDIGDQYVIGQDQITRGKFLGKGAFGAVFAGKIIDKFTSQTVEVAIKMLQPIDPGAEATFTQQEQYKVEKKLWDKDPMKNACEAYLNARQELSIMRSLINPHIVPLLGVSLQPLCLILPLAPQGALDTKLKHYRRAGARLPLYAIQRIIIQVSSALDYLHSHQIIYRDLKAENILVWSLPAPHSSMPLQEVHVKMADYGVSRAILPSGTKGFAGTPPFIAPEIIQHNGEEAYTEKVDCFSFGMFLYELLLLKMPFEGSDTAAAGNIKGHVLAGGRPAITTRDLMYPMLMLDLMTICWSHDPNDRPSAKAILRIARNPELCHLRDAVSLDVGVEVTCACCAPAQLPEVVPFSPEDAMCEAPPPMTEVWLATASGPQGYLLVHTYEQEICLHAKTIQLGACIVTSLCVADTCVWCADTTATVHVFCLKTYQELLSFPATKRPNVRVRNLVYSPKELQIYVVLDNGRLVLCESKIPRKNLANFNPVKTECPGNGKPIYCLSVLTRSDNSCELWCGQSQGKIAVWNLHDAVRGIRTVNHFDPHTDNMDVSMMTTNSHDCHAVWTYIYPGSRIFRWDAKHRRITSSLDCATMAPPSDKVFLNNEGRLPASKCQVTALRVMQNEIYIGTTWGCLIMADNQSMTLLNIIRCHGSEYPAVRAILPLVFDEAVVESEEQGEHHHQPSIVTIGKGYREVISHKAGPAKLKPVTSKPPASPQTYLLSWLADGWLASNVCQS